MAYKLVIGDPDTGKSYQREIKDTAAKRMSGLAIGDAFEGELVGLTGYQLTVTGGSDKTGTPMKAGIPGAGRTYMLSGKGRACHPKRDVRVRKLVAGERIGENTVQVNATITKKGRKGLETLLGVTGEESPQDGEEEQAKSEEKPQEPQSSEDSSKKEAAKAGESNKDDGDKEKKDSEADAAKKESKAENADNEKEEGGD